MSKLLLCSQMLWSASHVFSLDLFVSSMTMSYRHCGVIHSYWTCFHESGQPYWLITISLLAALSVWNFELQLQLLSCFQTQFHAQYSVKLRVSMYLWSVGVYVSHIRFDMCWFSLITEVFSYSCVKNQRTVFSLQFPRTKLIFALSEFAYTL